jgi:hypothetical protein
MAAILSCVVLLSRILLFVILPLGGIVESKRKYKNNTEANKSFKAMTLYEKIQIVD